MKSSFNHWLCLTLAALLTTGSIRSDEPAAKAVTAKGLSLSLWAREPQVMDPVALSFDDRGVLYVAETARRGTVDIDIRSHRDWLVEDLANQSVEDLRQAFRRWMAPERSQENAPWLRDLNGDGVHDWHDLEPIKERIRRLEDTQNTGHADRSQIFTEGFNEEISGVVAGVLPWDDSVWVTGYPELKRVRDTNHDGIADTQQTEFRGFGVHAAFDGHDLHGLIIGPDGKLYFSCGDNGFSVTNREGRILRHPNTGGVLRMSTDGSNLEVYATGLRNPQEIAFDDDGNFFAVDNDGDLREERERFVHIAEGSDSGWRLHWQFRDPGWKAITRQPNYHPWMDEHLWVPTHPDQPAYITPPLTNYSVGPGSLVHNPGTALSEAYRDHFFLIQFPVKKVTTFKARARGAGFEMVDERPILTGMMASCLAFSPDGSLFVGDWDGMWNPDGKGAIWVLDDPKAIGSPQRREVQGLLRDGLKGHTAESLTRLLGHADQRIRLRSQFEWVRRGSAEPLLKVANDLRAPTLARIHALWGLGQLRTPLKAGQLPLTDPEARVRAQAAKVAGDLRIKGSETALILRLRDENARVRFQAALALGKVGNISALGPLVSLLEDNSEHDPFLRHAATLGLSGLQRPELLAKLKQHRSVEVRIGAVVALRRLASPLLAGFLNDPHPRVRREAAIAIHDDESVPEALPALAECLDALGDTSDEAILRRALSANLRLGTAASGRRLSAYAQRATAPEALRIEALDSLASWNASPFLDRVEGRVRLLPSRAPDWGRQLLTEAIEPLWLKASPTLRLELARLVFEQQLAAPTGLFVDCVRSQDHPVALRAQALKALARAKAPELLELVQSLTESASGELRQTALEIQAERSPAKFLEYARNHWATTNVSELQWNLRLVAQRSEPEATTLLSQHVDRLTAGTLPQALILDLQEALRRHGNATLVARVTAWEHAHPEIRTRSLLSGGNPEEGRRLFQGSVQGQCGRCHNAGGEGQQAGPVLQGIGQRTTPEYLLESLLNPSARIAEGYATVSLSLKNGESVDGLLLQDTDGRLRLRLSTGELRNLPNSDIATRSANPQSVMPPMGDVLSHRELRDLVAFLSSWR